MIERVEGQAPSKKVTERYVHSLPPEQQVAHLELILEASRGLNATLDLDGLLQSILDIARRLTGAQAGAVLLLDQHTGELYLEARVEAGRPAEIERLWVGFEGSIAGWILQHGELLVVDDSQANAHAFSEISQLINVIGKTILAVPLKIGSDTIGVLELFDKEPLERGFGGDDIYTLTTLAAQAAIAIENARRFEQRDALERLMEALGEPTASIMGFSRLMLVEQEFDPEAVQSGLKRINDEAGRLARMIDDFLLLTRLESGRLSLKLEKLDLVSLTKMAVGEFEHEAEQKEIEFRFELDETLPDIKGDGHYLRQVVYNLIEHTLREHWQRDQVVITLSHNGVRVQLSVGHGGNVIGSDELRHLFDQFYHSPGQTRSDRAGLGLPLAKKIIEVHGGDIWVESGPDSGSRFAFSLPVA